MRARLGLRWLALVFASLLGAPAWALAGEPAPPASEPALSIARGRQIYLTGVPVEGAPLLASVGDPAMEVPASIMKCANCHGRDGRGKAEGGIAPANIRWEELTKPYRQAGQGRQRTAYTAKLLVRAIAAGIDASGNRLQPAMPRYRLTHQQAADLVAYLEVLGREADPGVTETSLKIGVVLPPSGVSGSAQASSEVLAAFARQINRQGGLYGRRLELAFAACPEEVATRAGAIRDFVEKERPFALLASYLVGCEEEIGRYLEETEVPLLGPTVLYANDAAARRRYVFHLLAGLAGQGQALARFAAQVPELSRSTALVVYREGDDESRSIGEAIGQRLLAAGWKASREVPLAETAAPDWAALLGNGATGAVFWLAPPAGFEEFFRAASAAGAYPYLFAPSALAGRELWSAPPGFTKRIYCSFPSLASDQSAAGRRELLELAGETPFADGSFSRAALASAKLLAHGLRQAGQEITRQKLVETLESLYGFASEQTPALTFTRNRRVGADGAHVVGIDVQQKAPILPSTWVRLD